MPSSCIPARPIVARSATACWSAVTGIGHSQGLQMQPLLQILGNLCRYCSSMTLSVQLVFVFWGLNAEQVAHHVEALGPSLGHRFRIVDRARVAERDRRTRVYGLHG